MLNCVGSDPVFVHCAGGDMSWTVFVQILLLFVLLVVLSLVCAVANSIWTGRHSNKDWYLFYEGQF